MMRRHWANKYVYIICNINWILSQLQNCQSGGRVRICWEHGRVEWERLSSRDSRLILRPPFYSSSNKSLSSSCWSLPLWATSDICSQWSVRYIQSSYPILYTYTITVFYGSIWECNNIKCWWAKEATLGQYQLVAVKLDRKYDPLIMDTNVTVTESTITTMY